MNLCFVTFCYISMFFGQKGGKNHVMVLDNRRRKIGPSVVGVNKP